MFSAATRDLTNWSGASVEFDLATYFEASQALIRASL